MLILKELKSFVIDYYLARLRGSILSLTQRVIVENEFYPISNPLCETNEKTCRPVTITTVTASISSGLKLNNSRVSVKKSNLKGTTRANKIKFVERVQSCFDNNSRTFKNLYHVAFSEEALLMAWHDISKSFLDINWNPILKSKIKEISVCLTNSSYHFGTLKKA